MRAGDTALLKHFPKTILNEVKSTIPSMERLLGCVFLFLRPTEWYYGASQYSLAPRLVSILQFSVESSTSPENEKESTKTIT